jgi:hypothetical protein
VRLFFVFVGIGVATCAHADRLFSIPMGRSLPKGTYRFEQLSSATNRFAKEQFFAFVPISELEIELQRRERSFESNGIGVNLSYNLFTPIAGLSPGISVGVLDSLNETALRRRGFIAITFRDLFDVSQNGEYGDVTFGYQFGSKTAGFIGCQLPFSTQLKAIAEFNGQDLTTGLSFQFSSEFRGRVFIQNNITLAGFSYSHRF